MVALGQVRVISAFQSSNKIFRECIVGATSGVLFRWLSSMVKLIRGKTSFRVPL